MRFRRIGKGPITRIKRRRAVSRKRKFPIAKPHGKLVMREQSHREREFIRMRTQWRYTVASGSATGSVGCNFIEAYMLNDIWTPAKSIIISLNEFGSSAANIAASLPVNGYQRQDELYTNWQVRGARCTVRVTMDSTGGSHIPLEFMLVAVPHAQLSSIDSTVPWERMRKHIIRSKVMTLMPTSDATNKYGCMGTVSLFTSPAKVMGTPLYYSGITNSSGTGTTPPTDDITFKLLMNWKDNYSVAPTFHIEVTLDYSVMWWGRKLPTLSLEEQAAVAKHVPAEAKEESKEEKKTDDDELDDTEEAFDRLPMITTEEKKAPEARGAGGAPPKGGGGEAPIEVTPPSSLAPKPLLRSPSPAPKPLLRTMSGPIKRV